VDRCLSVGAPSGQPDEVVSCKTRHIVAGRTSAQRLDCLHPRNALVFALFVTILVVLKVLSKSVRQTDADGQ